MYTSNEGTVEDMKQVNSLKARKFAGHEHANAIVLEGTDKVSLISCETQVASIDAEGWLEVTGLCGATTRRHIGWFLKEYGRGATYKDAKYCVDNDVVFNILSKIFVKEADKDEI